MLHQHTKVNWNMIYCEGARREKTGEKCVVAGDRVEKRVGAVFFVKIYNIGDESDRRY